MICTAQEFLALPKAPLSRPQQAKSLLSDLKPGDLVTTFDHGPQPICWVDSSTLGDGASDLAKNTMPIRIKPWVFSNTRALVVSPLALHFIARFQQRKSGLSP